MAIMAAGCLMMMETWRSALAHRTKKTNTDNFYSYNATSRAENRRSRALCARAAEGTRLKRATPFRTTRIA